MWTEIRQEIERGRKDLQLTSAQFRAVGSEEWERIGRKVEAAFREPVAPAKRRPLLWTQLWPDLARTSLSNAHSDETTLPRLRTPWADEARLFFFAQEFLGRNKTWWHRTNVAAAWQLLEYWWQKPKPVQEWGLVDAKYQWALFVTHADDILFCGEPLVSRVRQLGQQNGVQLP